MRDIGTSMMRQGKDGPVLVKNQRQAHIILLSGTRMWSVTNAASKNRSCRLFQTLAVALLSHTWNAEQAKSVGCTPLSSSHRSQNSNGVYCLLSIYEQYAHEVIDRLHFQRIVTIFNTNDTAVCKPPTSHQSTAHKMHNTNVLLLNWDKWNRQRVRQTQRLEDIFDEQSSREHR